MTAEGTIIEKIPPYGREVRVYPDGEPKSPFHSGHFLTWVAYRNQDKSFKDRYAEHIRLARQALREDIKEDLSPDALEALGVGLDGVGLYHIFGSPKLFLPVRGTGHTIGQLACGLWHFREGMSIRDIVDGTNRIFATYAGRSVISDAQNMGMVLPPPRGKGWDVPENARLVLQANFTNTGIVVPTYELLQQI